MNINYKKKNIKDLPQKMVQNNNDSVNTIKDIDKILTNDTANAQPMPIIEPFSNNYSNAYNISNYVHSMPKEVLSANGRKGALMANKKRKLESVAQKILDQKPNQNERALMEELGEEIDDEADAREIMLRCCKNYGMNGNVKYMELLLKASGEMPKDSQTTNVMQVNGGVEQVMNIFDSINEIDFGDKR